MEHADHLELIREGVAPGGRWLELGSGTGAFTLALAELIGPEAELWSIDRDAAALRTQERALRKAAPGLRATYVSADFRMPLRLPEFDGVLAANALHFVDDQDLVFRGIERRLRPGGRLIVVEYDSDRADRWVPHPLPFRSLESLARRAGLPEVREIGRRPSRYQGAIYAAVATRASG